MGGGGGVAATMTFKNYILTISTTLSPRVIHTKNNDSRITTKKTETKGKKP